MWQVIVASSVRPDSSSGGVVITPERAQSFGAVALLTQKECSDRHHPLPKKAFTEHVREIGASSPEHAGVLAAGLAEIIEQYAQATAARVAELVSAPRQSAAQQTYYTVAEAAEYLRCCRGRIYNLSSQGRLKGRKDGGRLLFTRADLDRIVEASP